MIRQPEKNNVMVTYAPAIAATFHEVKALEGVRLVRDVWCVIIQRILD